MESRVAEYFKKNPAEFTKVNCFFFDLMCLLNAEKYFKSNQKKGMNLLIMDSNSNRMWATSMSLEEFLNEEPLKEYKTYRSLEDFIIN